jgi:hypothetical protein
LAASALDRRLAMARKEIDPAPRREASSRRERKTLGGRQQPGHEGRLGAAATVLGRVCGPGAAVVQRRQIGSQGGGCWCRALWWSADKLCNGRDGSDGGGCSGV